MKKYRLFFIPLIFLLFFSCDRKVEESLPLHNKRVLIIGNSITQNGKYVDFLEYYLRKNYPEESLDMISIGLSSETVSGDSEVGHPFPRPCIHARLKEALDKIKPEVVMACYGMNDAIFSEKDSTRFSNYKKGIYNLKTIVEKYGARLMLLTPTPFDKYAAKDRLSKEGEAQSYKQPYYNYNRVLQDYANWLLTLKDNTVINLHEYLNNELTEIKKIKEDSTFIPDAVHPNTKGHFFMAKKIIKDLYPHIKIGDEITELNQLEKNVLFTIVQKRRKIRSKGWREFVGYTREKTVKSNHIDSTKQKVAVLDKRIQNILKKSF
ncbi:GDSL-type esterase/lipase family protein [uncultured Polaribacter sp.]|uniref:GDSL-type esterase/lipase family protein n=1 Tax=uncultured Polaribacter sp. TaxID=174711 RepID=UPI002639AF2B|nr:GDSL-type esterase/lipase family protein [uncultured Polaribacter sp.]